ncbi:MAG: hypothetical protein P4L56_27055 [Candidatus Sulfopaludibacter sp.]|nr:hypothetical protein [Candidatus Sulfopaludibacter sp.]
MAGAPTPFRQILETRLSQLAADTELLFADARQRARGEVASELNQAARRLFQAGAAEELASTLASAAAPYASTVLVFRIEGDVARSPEIDVPLSSAAALSGAMQTRDPVIAAATPGEVSAALVDRLAHSPEDRAYVFPLVAAGKVPALLYACGAVQGPALELLAQVAAAAWIRWLPATPPPESPAPARDLVSIAPAVSPPPVSPWDRLSTEEQQIHLRAQRWARVRMAELRLRQSAAVQAARSRGNVYQALREHLDRAREEYRKAFFAPCPSMVDYLHLEMLRTLAHDDADLLGKDYPGPLV